MMVKFSGFLTNGAWKDHHYQNACMFDISKTSGTAKIGDYEIGNRADETKESEG